jgi:hypothetical protein
VLVGGTAIAVGLAVLSERARAGGLSPAMAGGGAAAVSATGFAGRLSSVRARVDARGIGHATVLGAAAAALGALVMALAYGAVMVAGAVTTSSASAATREAVPVSGATAAAGGGWEQAYALAVPDAAARGVALLGETQRQHQIDTLIALHEWGEREKAAQEAQQARAAGYPAPGRPTTYNTSSGYGPGTVLYARITIYGCVGRGGGFCGGMASGYTVFEGSAACSSDMKMGTKFTVQGDPTGRVYECMDRGHLASPWVDIFFYNTADGFAWASALGGTHANITIVN